MKSRRRCPEVDPDCFNCKYHDCVANNHDIIRQITYQKRKLLEARNEEIWKLYQSGVGVKCISEKYDMAKGSVREIIKRMKNNQEGD